MNKTERMAEHAHQYGELLDVTVVAVVGQPGISLKEDCASISAVVVYDVKGSFLYLFPNQLLVTGGEANDRPLAGERRPTKASGVDAQQGWVGVYS